MFHLGECMYFIWETAYVSFGEYVCIWGIRMSLAKEHASWNPKNAYTSYGHKISTKLFTKQT